MQHYRSCCPSHQLCCTATSLLPKHACKQHMQVSCSTAQVCCTALAPLMCLTRASRFASSHAALPLMLLKSPSQLQALFFWLAAKACMQAAHASVLQHSTRSVLHSTSTTDVLDKGQQVCKQPCSITAHAAQVINSAVQLQACCQSMQAVISFSLCFKQVTCAGLGC